jgi:hypothetical protein
MIIGTPKIQKRNVYIHFNRGTEFRAKERGCQSYKHFPLFTSIIIETKSGGHSVVVGAVSILIIINGDGCKKPVCHESGKHIIFCGFKIEAHVGKTL